MSMPLTPADMMVAAIALLVVVSGILLLRFYVRRMAWRMVENVLQKQQHIAFELRLRDLVFRDPALFVGRLWANDRVGFVSGLWEEVGRKLAQHGAPAGLTPAGMAVDCLHLPDGRGIAVVKLPEFKGSSEFVLIGVVLPADPTFTTDTAKARAAARYFVLRPYSSGRSTDLCEWTAAGKELTYNIGAPRDAAGFARIVGETLQRLGR